MEIMFGMKLIISAVLLLSTVGNLSDNLRNCGLILSWFSCKHAEFCVCAIEQNKMHVLTQTCIFQSHFCHFELSLKLWVLRWDLATCLCPIGAVLQVPQANKLLPLLQMSVFPQGENINTQRKSTKDHTWFCLFVSVSWKNNFACECEKCMSMWYNIIEEGPHDQR